MKKGTKIALWSIGGLAVATGLFFGVRAIIRATKPNGGGIVPPPPPPNPPPVTPVEPPVKEEPKIRGGSFPIRYGDRGPHVEAWQKAINKWDDDWCSWSSCHGGTWRSKIVVDGVFGEQTALYTNCHYPSTDCALCPLYGAGSTYPVGSADYSQCKVTWDKFKSVVGSSTANKYKNFSGAGYSNANGGGRVNTHYNGSCCEWCQDLSMGRAIGNVPPEGCSDWMCGNTEWCPDTKPLVPGRPSGRPGLAPGFNGINEEKFSNYVYTQAEGDSVCAGAFGGGSTMVGYDCSPDANGTTETCTVECSNGMSVPVSVTGLLEAAPTRFTDNRGGRGKSKPNTLKRFSGELSDDDYLNMLKGFRG
jgi:hypothetical protein